jgi:hypothetical protein
MIKVTFRNACAAGQAGTSARSGEGGSLGE